MARPTAWFACVRLTNTNPTLGVPSLSSEVISKNTDKAMGNGTPSNSHTQVGISVRYGPVGDGDIEMQDSGPTENGTGPSKRKSRGSLGNGKSYAEPESSEEDDKPLVRDNPITSIPSVFPFVAHFVAMASHD